jgi:CsbD-like
MDWNRIEGNWKQTQGKIKEKWGKLTDDDLTMINGRREQLEGIHPAAIWAWPRIWCAKMSMIG